VLGFSAELLSFFGFPPQSGNFLNPFPSPPSPMEIFFFKIVRKAFRDFRHLQCRSDLFVFLAKVNQGVLFRVFFPKLRFTRNLFHVVLLWGGTPYYPAALGPANVYFSSPRLFQSFLRRFPFGLILGPTRSGFFFVSLCRGLAEFYPLLFFKSLSFPGYTAYGMSSHLQQRQGCQPCGLFFFQTQLPQLLLVAPLPPFFFSPPRLGTASPPP